MGKSKKKKGRKHGEFPSNKNEEERRIFKECEKAVEENLKQSGVKKDIDVRELDLVKKNLRSIPDTGRFRFLKLMFLNDNKIKEIRCHSLNCGLTELHLQNNSIKSVKGALNHLSCLQLLFLHNNEIRGLDETVYELRRLHQLRNTTFFLNPICDEPGYRDHMIHSLPFIEILDKKEVKPSERRLVHIYEASVHRLFHSVAFGTHKT